MYLDLVEEGYDDIKFIGVNGYEYINNDFNEWLAWNYNENIVARL